MNILGFSVLMFIIIIPTFPIRMKQLKQKPWEQKSKKKIFFKSTKQEGKIWALHRAKQQKKKQKKKQNK